MTKVDLLNRVKTGFKFGTDSYVNLSAGVLRLLKDSGPLGIEAAVAIIETVDREWRTMVMEDISRSRDRNPPTRDVLATDTLPYQDLLLNPACQSISIIDPFACLVCEYHPNIHFYAAISTIIEALGEESDKPVDLGAVKDRLFSCLDFTIAYIRRAWVEPQGIRLITALTRCCVLAHRHHGQPDLPAWLQKIMHEEIKVSEIEDKWHTTAIRMDLSTGKKSEEGMIIRSDLGELNISQVLRDAFMRGIEKSRGSGGWVVTALLGICRRAELRLRLLLLGIER